MDKPQPRYLSAPIRFQAADGAAADTLPSQFAGIAYSGERVADGWNAVIDLSTTKAEASMPLLYAHDQTADVGAVDSVSIGSDIRVAGKIFSDIDPTAKLLAEKAKRGAKYQMSVGLWNYAEKWVPPDQSVTVNGREFAGPITVLSGGTLREVSIVPLGADPRTSATFFQAGNPGANPQAAPAATNQELSTMDAAAIKAMQDANAKLIETNAALTARIEAIEAERKAEKAAALSAAKATREVAVKALFADTGRQYTPEAAAAYLDPAVLPEATFAQLAADLRAVAKIGANPALFQHVATGGEDGKGTSQTPGQMLVANMQALCGVKS